MKNIFLIFTAILLLTGCGTKVKKVPVDNQDTLESKYVSFRAPALDWYLYDDKKWAIQGNGKAHMINLYNRSKKGTSYTIGVDAYPFKWIPIDILFEKDGEYFDSDKKVEKYSENDKEQGINYKKGWITYINNLKCTGGVFSRTHGGTLYSAITKNYSIECGYYDKTESENDGKRILAIDYKYSYANGKSRLQKDSSLKREELLTREQAEDGLKQAVKELVKTIKIKNFDRERMEKEGLMHYDKEFESTKW